jgi:hypothetical protein
MRKFLDILNTPMAVLAVLMVVVAVNSFLYFGHYDAPAVPPAPSTESTPLAEEGTNPSTVPEPTDGQEEEGQRLRETTGETAVPSGGAATTASPSASPSATSSASASPSPP